MRHVSYESGGAHIYESPPPLKQQRAGARSGGRPALAVRVEPRVVALIAQYDSIIDRVAAEHGMDGNIVRGIIAAESGGRSNAGRGRGYKGLMQAGTDASQYDPETSIRTGVGKFVQFRRTISRLLRGVGIDISAVDKDTMVRWVATSYNAGPGTVIRAVKYALAAGNAGNWMQAEHFQKALIFTGAYSIAQAASSCLRGQQQQPGNADLIATAGRERVNLRGREIPLAQARATISPLLLCAIEFKHRNIPRYVERILTYMRAYDRRASSPAPESFEFPVDGFGLRSSYENWQSGLNRPHAFGRDGFGFETNSQELEVSVNRNSPAYIKWVQQSLNTILGLRLATDGDRGPQTRHAIRSFQKRNGLKDDGKVGARTEAALIAAGAGSPTGTSPAVPSNVPTQPGPPRAASSPPQVPFDIEFLIQFVQGLLTSIVPILGAAGAKLPTAVRFLTLDEQKEATSVFGKSLDFSKILIADGTGFQKRPFTVAVPVSSGFYVVMLLGDIDPWHTRNRSDTLIHELTHAWQSQHADDPTAYVKNSIRCQAGALAYLPFAKAEAAAAAIGLNVFNPWAVADPRAVARGAQAAADEDVSAYAYLPGGRFDQYAAEQIAQQIEDGYSSGRPIPAIVTPIQSAGPNIRVSENEASLQVLGFERKSTPGVVFP